ncbi:glycosyl hydrolase [Boeremia exigua]|uniref:glycosyl hydrolase n=1 Tax=Boeremia exigua TaxID=749465 RepID=UPI001E8E9B40|nr:glycosyl hydrolase [Boeremia exigua]KAH6633809.1 glycosyl hydrolase [Boeremia exigua]
MFRNPVIPGFAPDPSVVLVDGIFFLATSSFHFFPGIPIYASVDLQNWAHIAMPLDDGNTMVASGGLFAPTIRYNDGAFYIVCTNCYHGHDNWKTDNFLITTRDIWSNKWSDPVHFSFYGIDPSLFFDDDGRAFIQGSWLIDRMKQPSCTIKQFEIDITNGKHLSDTHEIWTGFAKRDTEGPHIYKKDGWYYLLVAEGGTFEHHMLSIARARDIWGPYESCPQNPIMTADGTEEYVQNIGHGEIFQDASGNWWAAVLGVRENNGKQPMGRETFLTTVDWPIDEWPVIQQPRMSLASTRTLPGSTPAFLDKLRSIRPNVADLYLHLPVGYDAYSSPTCVVLQPTKNDLSSSHGTALLARRQRSVNSVASTTVGLPANKAEAQNVVAGLTVYKDPLRHLSIIVDLATRLLSVNFVDASKDYTFTAVNPDPMPQSTRAVEMRIVSSPAQYEFTYRLEEGKEWMTVGSADAALLSAKDFTGSVFGVFAVCEQGETHTAKVSFSNFIVED